MDRVGTGVNTFVNSGSLEFGIWVEFKILKRKLTKSESESKLESKMIIRADSSRVGVQVSIQIMKKDGKYRRWIRKYMFDSWHVTSKPVSLVSFVRAEGAGIRVGVENWKKTSSQIEIVQILKTKLKLDSKTFGIGIVRITRGAGQ
jgi:hypothetical protein